MSWCRPGSDEDRPSVDPLKYQFQEPGNKNGDDYGNEFLTIKIRYKQPDGLTSRLMVRPVAGSVRSIQRASENLRFASAVAEFGMVLRNSGFKGNSTLEQVANLAGSSRGEDPDGYRAEFIRLVRTVGDMKALSDR